jgi:hypothetical protein
MGGGETRYGVDTAVGLEDEFGYGCGILSVP